MSLLRHRASGRSVKAAGVLLAVWAVLLWLWLRLEAAPLVVGLMFAVTLPALWDFVTGRPAGLVLDGQTLRWNSGRQSGEVALTQIEKARFETRLDLSVRVRLLLRDGRKITLPQDALPPHRPLQDAMDVCGVITEREHFRLL